MDSILARWSDTCFSLHVCNYHQIRIFQELESSSLPFYSILVFHTQHFSLIIVSRCTEAHFGDFFEEQPESGNCAREYCSHLWEKDAKILVYLCLPTKRLLLPDVILITVRGKTVPAY